MTSEAHHQAHHDLAATLLGKVEEFSSVSDIIPDLVQYIEKRPPELQSIRFAPPEDLKPQLPARSLAGDEQPLKVSAPPRTG